MPDTILKGDHPRIISAKFGWDWLSRFRGEDFLKFHTHFFLFLAWWPSWLEVRIIGHNFGRGPSKDHSTKVWLQLVQWFLRRRLKCEMLMDRQRTTDDRRRTKSDDNSSPGLKARWAKNYIKINSRNWFGPVNSNFHFEDWCITKISVITNSTINWEKITGNEIFTE